MSATNHFKSILALNPLERPAKIVDVFGCEKSWEDRYKLIIDWGKELEPILEQYKKPEFLVKGCQSSVWLFVELTTDEKCKIHVDSDASIVKGLVALIYLTYEQVPLSEMNKIDLQFFKEIGLIEHLSLSRANGLQSMIKTLKMFGIAYAHQKSQNK